MKYIIPLISFLMLLGCEKTGSDTERDYPLVITMEPEVYTGGATFSARIISLGFEPVEQYGFVWSENTDPDISDFSVFMHNNVPADKTYNYDPESRLTDERTYYVRACIKTRNYIIYGNEVSFLNK